MRYVVSTALKVNIISEKQNMSVLSINQRKLNLGMKCSLKNDLEFIHSLKTEKWFKT